MKKKVNHLVRLYYAMQERLKTASYSEQIQTLTLVSDNVPRMYCSEYFNVFEYLVWASHEIKKVGELLAKPAPKKRKKTIATEKLRLITNFYDDGSFSRYVPEKKDYISASKGVDKQRFATCKSLCNLQELFTAFKEKHSNVNIAFSKLCTLRPKWCVLTGSKWLALFVFVALIKMLCC